MFQLMLAALAVVLALMPLIQVCVCACADEFPLATARRRRKPRNRTVLIPTQFPAFVKIKMKRTLRGQRLPFARTTAARKYGHI